MTKIEFRNGQAPAINDTNLNAIQNYIEQAIAEAKAEAKLEAHPIGSYYWSGESTDPSTLFGGTWEQVKDKFVLAVGDTYTTVGATGGNSSHNLDISNVYAQANPTGGGINYQNANKAFNTNYAITGSGGGKSASSQSNSNAGIAISGTLNSGDNNPPYITAYCWKRTA